MKLSWLNTLQIAGNVGILAGLILVAFQMRQNSALLSAQLMHQETDRYIAVESVAMGENFAATWSKVLSDPKSLTVEEQIIAEAYIFSSVERWRSLHRLSNQGLGNPDWKSLVVENASYILTHPYGRAWWNTFISDPNVLFPKEVIKLVNNVLLETPDEDPQRYFSEMMDQLRSDVSPSE